MCACINKRCRKYKLRECKFVEVSTRWSSQASLYVWTYPHSSMSSHEGVWSIYVIQVILILILFTRFPADAPSSPCAASLSSWPWYECPRSPQASWDAIPAKVIHEYQWNSQLAYLGNMPLLMWGFTNTTPLGDMCTCPSTLCVRQTEVKSHSEANQTANEPWLWVK